jgi:hypothetical protein
METYHQADDDEETDDDDDDDDRPITQRKKRVSGLVKLTGKPKIPQQATAKKPRTKETSKRNKVQESIPASDNDATPKPAVRKSRGRPKSGGFEEIEVVQNPGDFMPVASRSNRTETSNDMHSVVTIIPDSGGESNDVWVISSDEG